jgi:hypothetical protein
MNYPKITFTFKPPLKTPHLPYAQAQQPRSLALLPPAVQNRRHHLQSIPLWLTHLNPVSVHPLSHIQRKRTFLTS